jgi:rod shape-determining protein MreC
MRSRIAYFLLIVIALILNFPQVYKAAPIVLLRSSLQDVGYFFEWSTALPFRQASRFAAFVVTASGLEKENLALKDKLKQDEAKLLELKSVEVENQGLRSALEFRESNPYGFNLVPAEVVSRGGEDLTIVVNKGEDDGVRAGQTVINQSGLVGRVSETSKISAKVSLLTDPINVISAVLQRSGTYGVVRGGARLTMDYVTSSISVEAGEKVVVSNSSTTFERGLPIGTVRSAGKKIEDLFQKIDLIPAVDFSKLDVVYICQP